MNKERINSPGNNNFSKSQNNFPNENINTLNSKKQKNAGNYFEILLNKREIKTTQNSKERLNKEFLQTFSDNAKLKFFSPKNFTKTMSSFSSISAKKFLNENLISKKINTNPNLNINKINSNLVTTNFKNNKNEINKNLKKNTRSKSHNLNDINIFCNTEFRNQTSKNKNDSSSKNLKEINQNLKANNLKIKNYYNKQIENQNQNNKIKIPESRNYKRDINKFNQYEIKSQSNPKTYEIIANKKTLYFHKKKFESMNFNSILNGLDDFDRITINNKNNQVYQVDRNYVKDNKYNEIDIVESFENKIGDFNKIGKNKKDIENLKNLFKNIKIFKKNK